MDLYNKKIVDHEFTMVQVIKGKRVSTPLGEGVEWEKEYNKKYSSVRVVVKLDEPSRWSCATENHPHPYMFLHDITYLE
jgi:hypothetical protein